MHGLETIRAMNRPSSNAIVRPAMDGEVRVLLRDALDYLDPDEGSRARELRRRIEAALKGREE